MAQQHTITIKPTDAHVEIRIDGEEVAKSDRAIALDETGLPTRYYLPKEDVRADLLRPTEHHTVCPYKGEASYWSVDINGTAHDNVAWSYETPIDEAKEITGLVCFYNNRVDLTVS
jgi:uncharacterized protein (DUF427 family)